MCMTAIYAKPALSDASQTKPAMKPLHMIFLTETVLSRLVSVANARQDRYNPGLIRIQRLAHIFQRIIVVTELCVDITQ